MHRVGTIKGRIDEPKNLAERLISRRLELKLSQGQVAEQVQFWNQKKQEWVELSRSAYCMYESGDVIPDIPKIEQIAKALKCAPQWLAFGDGKRNEVEEVDFDETAGDAGQFEGRAYWTLSEEWVRAAFGVEPGDIALCGVHDHSASLKPGDVAVVLKGVEPSINGAEFVFAEDGAIKNAQITKPGRGNLYRIYDATGRGHREADPATLVFLGRVVGKIATL